MLGLTKWCLYSFSLLSIISISWTFIIGFIPNFCTKPWRSLYGPLCTCKGQGGMTRKRYEVTRAKKNVFVNKKAKVNWNGGVYVCVRSFDVELPLCFMVVLMVFFCNERYLVWASPFYGHVCWPLIIINSGWPILIVIMMYITIFGYIVSLINVLGLVHYVWKNRNNCWCIINVCINQCMY